MKTPEEQANEFLASIKVDKNCPFSLADVYLTEDGKQLTFKSIFLAGYSAGRADAQRWIPVEERLPEPGQQILVLVGSKLTPDVATCNGGFETLPDYFECGRFGDVGSDSVGFWLPLPAAPKGEG